MKLYIRNMVCSRCRLIVKAEVEKAGLQVLSVELGEVEVTGSLTAPVRQALDEGLRSYGFELMDDKRSRLIGQIKSLIVTLVHEKGEQLNINLSAYLSEKMGYDYKYLSGLFSEVEGTTIEKYHIAQRVEKVKELLVYNELSLSEIAHRLGYSSVAYLSAQFRRVTGLTPSFFRSLKDHKRRNIEDL